MLTLGFVESDPRRKSIAEQREAVLVDVMLYSFRNSTFSASNL
jgi:hypothetical protein